MGAAAAAAVEKAGRLLLLFNPSGKLNGGGSPTIMNLRAQRTSRLKLYLRTKRNNNITETDMCFTYA